MRELFSSKKEETVIGYAVYMLPGSKKPKEVDKHTKPMKKNIKL